ncbi:MAG: DUF3788 family protein [Melioribacteraceae bacterium]|nr:DUF3788 family protein [Melioribacteraceae bacterium]
MSASYFDDKLRKPTNDDLVKVLGAKYKFWEDIKKHISENYGTAEEEWKYYNQKSGWLLKLLLKKRNLFFMIPHDKYFNISFIFGDKAVSVIEKSNLSGEIISEIVNARKYMEGRGLSVSVKSKKDLQNIIKLLDIKVQN